jgi:hypothetical protein
MTSFWQGIVRRAAATPAWLRLTLAASAFALAIGAAGYRTVRVLNLPNDPRNDDRWGLGDFRDAIYYPVLAFWSGGNPYDPAYAADYPVYGVLPPYSPLTLMVHAPFGLLPYEIAEWTYFGMSALLVLALASASLRLCGATASASRVLALGALIALSRSGHVDLVLGQLSLQLGLSSLLALHFGRRRPWLAGLALAIVSLKPTFAVPVAGLMFCRGDYRAVVIGTALGTIGALTGALVISGGVAELPAFFETFVGGYRKLEQATSFDPTIAWSRVDAITVLSRLPLADASRLSGGVVAAVCLMLAGTYLVWRRFRWVEAGEPAIAELPAAAPQAVGFVPRPTLGARPTLRAACASNVGADDWSGVFICVVTMASCYHMAYDALLLVGPIVALAAARRPIWQSTHPLVRFALAAALAFPLLNYFSTRTALTTFGISGPLRSILACSSALALLFAWALLVWIDVRSRATVDRPDSPSREPLSLVKP